LLSRWWPGWRHSLHIVRPDTVIAWHRRGLRLVLDAKITATSGKTEPARRHLPLDSGHESSQPVVGSTAHSRGTAQVRDRSSTIDRGQISSPTAQAPIPNLANLLGQSPRTDGLDRLLRSADGDLPGSVCLRGVIACSTPCAALPGDRTPQPGLDDAADQGKRFPGTKGADIFCATAMRSTGMTG
jgi:hypothetical protein